MNKVLLIGQAKLTGFVDSQVANESVCHFTVTTTNRFPDGRAEVAVHRCTAAGSLGRNLSRVLSPDNHVRIYVEGRIMPGADVKIMANRVDVVGFAGSKAGA